jgi:hypothetical protein
MNNVLIEDDIFEKIIKIYKDGNPDDEKIVDELMEGNTDKGFLYKETVYKVK